MPGRKFLMNYIKYLANSQKNGLISLGVTSPLGHDEYPAVGLWALPNELLACPNFFWYGHHLQPEGRIQIERHLFVLNLRNNET